MKATRFRFLVVIAIVTALGVCGVLFAVFIRDFRGVSIGFLGYTTNKKGDVWAVFGVTNLSRLDYVYSVEAEPDVANSFWGNTTGIAAAGSTHTNQIWLSKRDVAYQLVMHAYPMPVSPSNVLSAPLMSAKSAWRFVNGTTRLDLNLGTFTPGTNAAITAYSALIDPQHAK